MARRLPKKMYNGTTLTSHALQVMPKFMRRYRSRRRKPSVCLSLRSPVATAPALSPSLPLPPPSAHLLTEGCPGQKRGYEETARHGYPVREAGHDGVRHEEDEQRAGRKRGDLAATGLSEVEQLRRKKRPPHVTAAKRGIKRKRGWQCNAKGSIGPGAPCLVSEWSAAVRRMVGGVPGASP